MAGVEVAVISEKRWSGVSGWSWRSSRVARGRGLAAGPGLRSLRGDRGEPAVGQGARGLGGRRRRADVRGRPRHDPRHGLLPGVPRSGGAGLRRHLLARRPRGDALPHRRTGGPAAAVPRRVPAAADVRRRRDRRGRARRHPRRRGLARVRSLHLRRVDAPAQLHRALRGGRSDHRPPRADRHALRGLVRRSPALVRSDQPAAARAPRQAARVGGRRARRDLRRAGRRGDLAVAVVRRGGRERARAGGGGRWLPDRRR